LQKNIFKNIKVDGGEREYMEVKKETTLKGSGI